uniref:THAP domain-containing protein 6 n=1 Tax=Lygus hesperus TaxID=30085 RepID=A0A0A9WNX9_LYGHE
MVCCAIAGCTNHGRHRKYKGIRFYQFPKNPELKAKWIIACGRADPLNVSTANVCSVHFQDSDYQRDLKNELLKLPLKLRLKPDAVPNLFIPDPIVVSNLTKTSSNNRKITTEKKRHRKIVQRVLRTPSSAAEISDFTIKEEFNREKVSGNSNCAHIEKNIEDIVLPAEDGQIKRENEVGSARTTQGITKRPAARSRKTAKKMKN